MKPMIEDEAPLAMDSEAGRGDKRTADSLEEPLTTHVIGYSIADGRPIDHDMGVLLRAEALDTNVDADPWEYVDSGEANAGDIDPVPSAEARRE